MLSLFSNGLGMAISESEIFKFLGGVTYLGLANSLVKVVDYIKGSYKPIGLLFCGLYGFVLSVEDPGE